MGITIEKLFEIWNDDTGSCIEVGPNKDGLGGIEIRAKDDKGKIEASVLLLKEEARLVAQALTELSK